MLREQTPQDVDDLAAILSDAATMRFYPKPFTRAQVERWIERNLRHYSERGYGLWALILKDGGDLVGQCGLWPQHVEGRDEVELAWHVNRRLWRRGYASEAALAARDHAFGALGLSRLISLIRPENLPSAGVARKVGMTPERDIIWAQRPHTMFSIEPAALA
ncbi:MAG: GNAT family N-acetyltransferase [Actinomycetota bacterium]